MTMSECIHCITYLYILVAEWGKSYGFVMMCTSVICYIAGMYSTALTRGRELYGVTKKIIVGDGGLNYIRFA